jgi:hypothetical protein
MNDEGELLDWIHFYGFFTVLMIVLGLAGGVAYSRLSSREFEASSVVLETSGQIPPRQLGPIAEAVFESEDVYGPAMRELGFREGPGLFLTEVVDLRPVPDTNALIVVGRANTVEEAKMTADVTARSLIAAFAERAQLEDFVTFGAPEASAPEGVVAIAVALGGSIGLWLALAMAVAHYWRVRPVLSVERALRITGVDLATIVDGRARWLGVLRRRPRWKRSRANRARLESIGVATESRSLTLVSAGGGPDQVAQPASGAPSRPVTATTLNEEDLEGLLVAHAGSSAHYLAEMSYYDPSVAAGALARPSLLWVR